MTDFRVLVTSSRTWDREDVIWGALDHLVAGALAAGYDRVVVVHGACPQGGDAHADAWYRARHDVLPLAVERYPANWAGHGRSAGQRRNREMVRLGAQVCLSAIRDGSPGASKCVEMAERAGIDVVPLVYDSLPERAT